VEDKIKIPSPEEGKPFPKAYYNIKGTVWKQDQLEYAEDCQALDIIKKLMTNKKVDSIVFGVMQFMAAPELPDLFAICLKPYTPNIWARLKQRYYAWKNKVDLKAPIKIMQGWQRKKILEDFFFFNVASRWNSDASDFISSLIGGISKNLAEIKFDGKNQSSMPQAENSQTEKK
jgi:hypothetical protein